MLNELRKLFWEMKHFKHNILFANLSFTFFIIGALQNSSQSNLELVLLMLLIWYISIHGFSIPMLIIEEEILEGTIVYMVLSEKSLFRILLDKCMAQIFYDILKEMIIFIPLAFLLFKTLPFRGTAILSLIPIGLSVGITYAVGILIASASLKFKQLGSIPSLLYYFIFFFESGILDITDASLSPLSFVLPFTFLRRFLLYQDSLFILYLVIQFCFWFFIARKCYNYFYKEMLQRGTVDHV